MPDQDIEQLIEQARAVMTCPTCGRHYASEEISFKALMEHTYILQTTCSNNHSAIFTTWITSYSSAETEATGPIGEDHVLALHSALQHFNGDFKALWPAKNPEER